MDIEPSQEEKKRNKGNAPVSRYGVFELSIDLITKTFSIRVSNHSATCQNYIKQNSNMDFNLSLVINDKRINKKRFKPDDRVVAEEYIYLGFNYMTKIGKYRISASS